MQAEMGSNWMTSWWSSQATKQLRTEAVVVQFVGFWIGVSAVIQYTLRETQDLMPREAREEKLLVLFLMNDQRLLCIECLWISNYGFALNLNFLQEWAATEDDFLVQNNTRLCTATVWQNSWTTSSIISGIATTSFTAYLICCRSAMSLEGQRVSAMGLVSVWQGLDMN